VRRAVADAEREVEREIRRAMAEVERAMADVSLGLGAITGEFGPGKGSSSRWASGFASAPFRHNWRSSWRGALAQWLQQYRTPSEGEPASPPLEEDLNEETLTVLRMLQEGKITAEEADRLLEAMEGE